MTEAHDDPTIVYDPDSFLMLLNDLAGPVEEGKEWRHDISLCGYTEQAHLDLQRRKQGAVISQPESYGVLICPVSIMKSVQVWMDGHSLRVGVLPVDKRGILTGGVIYAPVFTSGHDLVQWSLTVRALND